MLHKLLNLTRPLFVLDSETTGLYDDARIIELGFEKWTAEGLVREWRSLINPGIPIPPRITEITGISDADMANCQLCAQPELDHLTADHDFKPIPYFAQIAKSMAAGFSDCDFAGKNVRFDLKKIDAGMRRCNVPWSYEGARILDADRLEALALPRHLSDLYKKYTGEELMDAHSALVDVKATTTVLLAQLETHGTLPRDLDELHQLSWPGWLVADGSFRIIDDQPTITFGKHRYTPMREVPIGYWDFILKGDFPADVKRLASQAKLGKFPGDAPSAPTEEYRPLKIEQPSMGLITERIYRCNVCGIEVLVEGADHLGRLCSEGACQGMQVPI